MNVVDFETYIDEKEYFVVYCVCFIYNNNKYSLYAKEGEDILKSFFEKILDLSLTKFVEFYVHNLNFDGMLLIDYLSKINIKFEIFSIKFNLYWLKFEYSKTFFLFRCSYKILPISVKSMGEMEKYDKLFFPHKFVSKFTLYYEGEIPSKEYWEKNDYYLFISQCNITKYNLKAQSIDYCMRDVEIVYKSLSFIINIINSENKKIILSNFSTASISHYLFFSKYNKFSVIESLLKKDDLYIRNSFYGGRCEVFGNFFDTEYIKYYDFSGMYAQCMLEKFHYGKAYYAIPDTVEKPGFYSIDFISKDMDIPILPIHSDSGKLIFPNGILSGIYWYEEILYFLQNGGIVSKINHAILFEKEDYVFKDFVNNYMDLRKKGSYYNIFGKLMINSFYGSTALNVEDSTTYVTYSEEEVESIIKTLTVLKIHRINSAIILVIEKDQKYTKFYKKNNKIRVKRNVSIASSISSKARVKLHKLFIEIKKDGGRLLYCDTDSAFASYDLSDKREFLNDKKWLNFYKKAVFGSPKSYALIDYENFEDIKIKGFSNKKITYQKFEEAFYSSSSLEIEDQLVFSKRNFNLEKKNITKILNFLKYDKRVFDLNKKNTKPLEILNTPI